MGSCSSFDSNHIYLKQKTILLLGLDNSGIFSFINKLSLKNDTFIYNNSSYKFLISLDYNIKKFIYKFSDIIIYFIDITNKTRYEENTLNLINILDNKSYKNTPILLFINTKNKYFNLSTDYIYHLFNIKSSYNIIIKEYTEQKTTKLDILKILNNIL